MTQMHCSELRSDLWRYLDRELPAREMARISEHLRECGPCRRLFDARVADTHLVRAAFLEAPFGDGFLERFRDRFEREVPERSRYRPKRGASGAESGARGAPSGGASRRRRFAALVALSVAIPLLLVASLFLASSPGAGLGEYTVRRGRAELGSIGGATRLLEAGVGGALRPGSRLDAREGTELLIELAPDPAGEERTRIVLRGPASLRIEPGATASAFRARLGLGELTASVRRLGEGESFEIRTPEAVARVVGTRFTLRVCGDSTRLDVAEGTVAFAALRDGRARRGWSPVTRASGPHRVRAGGAGPEPVGTAALAGGERSAPEAQEGGGGGRDPAGRDATAGGGAPATERSGTSGAGEGGTGAAPGSGGEPRRSGAAGSGLDLDGPVTPRAAEPEPTGGE